jgi:hypothetical protein
LQKFIFELGEILALNRVCFLCSIDLKIEIFEQIARIENSAIFFK